MKLLQMKNNAYILQIIMQLEISYVLITLNTTYFYSCCTESFKYYSLPNDKYCWYLQQNITNLDSIVLS